MTRIKQERLAKAIADNYGKKKPKSHRQLIKEAGYSQSAADNPQRVVDNRSFAQIIKEELPDGPIIKNLYKQALKEDNVGVNAIKLVFEIKGKIIQRHQIDSELTPSEVDAKIALLESKLKNGQTDDSK